MTEKIKPMILSVEDIAATLRCSVSTVRALLSQGAIEKIKLGVRSYGTAESVAKIAREGVPKIVPKWKCPRVVPTIEVESTRKPRARMKKHPDAVREAIEIGA